MASSTAPNTSSTTQPVAGYIECHETTREYLHMAEPYTCLLSQAMPPRFFVSLGIICVVSPLVSCWISLIGVKREIPIGGSPMLTQGANSYGNTPALDPSRVRPDGTRQALVPTRNVSSAPQPRPQGGLRFQPSPSEEPPCTFGYVWWIKLFPSSRTRLYRMLYFLYSFQTLEVTEINDKWRSVFMKWTSQMFKSQDVTKYFRFILNNVVPRSVWIQKNSIC